MLSSTEQIIEHRLHEHIIRDRDLAQLLKGSDARRYGLVNKALKSGELIRICRGFYTLAAKYQKHVFSQYYLANRIVPNSFISAESALSFHGWIPERVAQVTSIAAFGRSRKFTTPLGIFVYRPVPVAPHNFYCGVNMIEIDKKIIYIATPLRALIDYVYWHKIKHANLDFLINSLRIETDNIASITKKEIKQLKTVYCLSYLQQFLQKLLVEIADE